MKMLTCLYKKSVDLKLSLYSPPPLVQRTGSINVIRPVFQAPKYIDSSGISGIFKGQKGRIALFLPLNLSKIPLESMYFGA